MSDMNGPIEVLYFYRTKWGAHDEFVGLFRKNHWPILREDLADGRFLDVRDGDAALPRRRPGRLGRPRLDHLPRLGGDGGPHRGRDRPSPLPGPGGVQGRGAAPFELLEAHWDVPLEARPSRRR